jgi:predicted alpha/beta superfamily hydrolase
MTPSEDKPPEHPLAGTELHTLHSTYVEGGFEISVGLPAHYKTDTSSYSVLFVPDAMYEFPLVLETLRLMQITGELPEILVVGIGYPTRHDTSAWAYRTRDLTPTFDAAADSSLRTACPTMPDFRSGGAESFLQFMIRELIPFIKHRYRVKESAFAFAGHSLGGLFALYALFEAPGAFQKMIIGSPSLWWDSGVMFQYEKRYSEKYGDLSAEIFLSVGADESVSAEMVENMKAMSDSLHSRGYENLKLDTCIFPDETHMSVIPATWSRGLRWIYRN